MEPHAHIVHPLLSLALRFLLLIVSLCLASRPFLPPSDQAHLPIEERCLEQPHLADFSTQVSAPFETAGSSTYAAPLPAEVTIPSHNVPTGQVPEVDCSHLTPVDIPRLHDLLHDHPDQNLVSYVINGLQYGFSTGFHGDLTRSASSNLKSATEYFVDVSKAIQTEIARGHTAGPFQTPPLRDFYCSPLGAVPKKDGSTRIILDLSSPRGSSVNDGIDNHTFRLSTVH